MEAELQARSWAWQCRHHRPPQTAGSPCRRLAYCPPSHPRRCSHLWRILGITGCPIVHDHLIGPLGRPR
eukprot:15475559-Alexandrium_andersonii.AAC.1